VKAVVFSEDALAPTERLFAGALEHLARRLGRVRELDPAALPSDRCAALRALAGWGDAGVSTWRLEMGRYYEEHVPLHARPRPELNAVLRRMRAAGARIAIWSPGPPEATTHLVHQLGLATLADPVRVEPRLEALAELARELNGALVVAADPAVLAFCLESGLDVAAAGFAGAAPADRARVLRSPAELLELLPAVPVEAR
jgi:phosphoglycolate phosphatase-like HAD superfamily hydrolase